MDNKFLRVAVGAALMVCSHLALASPIVCGDNTTESAVANGSVADDCSLFDGSLAHVNTLWASGDDFSEVGSLVGFTLTQGDGIDGYLVSYQLSVPQDFVGMIADWVLGVSHSQGNNNRQVAYLFNNVELGIEGGANNFFVSGNGNGNGNQQNSITHISGFIRLTAVNDNPSDLSPVPAPGILFLMFAGLGSLIASRRRTYREA